jgi:hypothetical protein
VAANLCSDHADWLGLQCTYTYGSPRVGDRNFGRRIERPLWRFRNDSDIVTHVPLGLVLRHAGVAALVDAAGHFHADPAPAEEAVFEAAAAGFSAGDAQHVAALLRAVEPRMRVPGILADHAPINYAIRLWNAYETE